MQFCVPVKDFVVLLQILSGHLCGLLKGAIITWTCSPRNSSRKLGSGGLTAVYISHPIPNVQMSCMYKYVFNTFSL